MQRIKGRYAKRITSLIQRFAPSDRNFLEALKISLFIPHDSTLVASRFAV
jgi:hypothetical protein